MSNYLDLGIEGQARARPGGRDPGSPGRKQRILLTCINRCNTQSRKITESYFGAGRSDPSGGPGGAASEGHTWLRGRPRVKRELGVPRRMGSLLPKAS